MRARAKIRTALLLVPLLASLLPFPLSPSTALAQPPPESPAPQPDAATATARTKFSAALKLIELGQWREAHTLLLEAWQSKQHWQIALQLSRVEVELRKYADAVEHLTFVRAAADTPDDARKEAALLLEQARAKMGHLRIHGTPLGARVLVDGVLVGKSPLAGAVDVDPGPHHVELRLGDQRAWERVTATSTETTDVRLSLGPLRPIRPPAPEVTAAATATPTPDATSARWPTSKWTWIGAIGGAALTSLAIGTGTGLVALDKQNEQDRCTHRPCFDALEPDRAVLARTSFGTLVMGGLLAGTAVALALFLPNEKPRGARPASVVRFHLAGQGMAISGSW